MENSTLSTFHFPLIKESPVDSEEDLAVAHWVMWRDEGVVVACEEEHVAILHEDVGLFDINCERQVDVRIVSNHDIVLKVKRP